MNYKYLNCNNCGANVRLNPGRQRTFCSSCGTQIIADEVFNKDSVESLLRRAESHMELGNYSRAMKAYEEIADFHPYVHYGWEGLIKAMTNNFMSVIDYSDISLLSAYMDRVKQTAPEDIYDDIRNKYTKYIRTVSSSIALTERSMVEERLASCEEEISYQKELLDIDKQQCDELLDEARSKRNYLRQAYEIPANKRKNVCLTGLALLVIAFIFSISLGFDFESTFSLMAGTSVPGVLVLIYGLGIIKVGMTRQEYEQNKRITNNVINEANKVYRDRFEEYRNDTREAFDLQNKFKAYLSMERDYLNRQVINRLMNFEDGYEVDRLIMDVASVMVE